MTNLQQRVVQLVTLFAIYMHSIIVKVLMCTIALGTVYFQALSFYTGFPIASFCSPSTVCSLPSAQLECTGCTNYTDYIEFNRDYICEFRTLPESARCDSMEDSDCTLQNITTLCNMTQVSFSVAVWDEVSASRHEWCMEPEETQFTEVIMEVICGLLTSYPFTNQFMTCTCM